MTRIAAQVGIPKARLYNFTSKGSMNVADIEKVASWLRQNDYLPDTAPSKPPEVLLVAELRALADLLESPDMPKEIKGERFVSAVRGWHGAIEKYAAVLKK